MSTAVFRLGSPSELGVCSGLAVKARDNSRLSVFTRTRISQRRFTLGRISATSSAAYGVARTDSVEARTAGEEAQNYRKDARVTPTAEYLDNELAKLLFSGTDPVRQIVLLTDGTNIRPFWLSWPSTCVIFVVSPGHMHYGTLQKMAASGLKVPKSSLVQLVSEDFAADENDDEDWGEKLLRVGYRGDKPSVWLLEMRKDVSHGYLEKILPVASSLLMKDSVFIGAVPASTSSEVESGEHLRKLFAGHGFLADFKVHEKMDPLGASEISAERACELARNQPPFLTFSTRQLRLSDPQVEYARNQIMMAEEEGDEEGFMDAW